MGAPVRVNEQISTNAAVVAPVNEKLAAASGSGTGEVTATPEAHNAEYLCPVTIGGQTLNLDVDTGSSDLWVLGAALHISLMKLTVT